MQSCNVYAQKTNYSFTELPEWVCQCIPGDSLFIFAVGVSDPGMGKMEALEQSKLRASALLALKEGFQFSKMFDSYKTQNDVEEISMKNSSNVILHCMYDTSGVKIEETFFSEFNECYVLVSKSIEEKKNTSNPFIFEASLFSALDEINTKVMRGILSINISENFSETDYSYSKYFLDSQVDIASTINDKIIPFTNNIYHYKNQNYCSIDSAKLTISESIRNSFWDGYITSIIRSTAYYFNSNVKVSGVSEDANSKSQTFNRVLVDEYYHLNISNLSIVNNTINMLVEIE